MLSRAYRIVSRQKKTEREAREHEPEERLASVVQFSGIQWGYLRDNEKGARGGVAQLGEHLPCKQGVMGSIPIISTNF